MSLPPLAAMLIVLAAFGGLLGALSIYRRISNPHPELLRKLLHVGMGLVTLSFPWLFDRVWPVLVLGILSIVLLLLLRLVPALRGGVGHVVSGVARTSLGDIYFPLSIGIIWLLYMNAAEQEPGRRLMGYIIPMLLLTLSDALAALVGVGYGRYRYATPDGMKSIEGSLAFFLCSFVCVHVPLLLLSDRGRAETLLMAVLLAWLATMFEAIAWGGLDNLILPPVAHFLLFIHWDLSADVLLSYIADAAVLSAIAIGLYRRTPLRGSAVLGAALLGYTFWGLGGWPWLFPPLLLFTASAALSLRYPAAKDKTLNVHALLSVTCVGLFWLCLGLTLDRPEYYFPFVVSFAAHLAMVTLGRLSLAHPHSAALVILSVSVGAGWLLMMTGYVLMQPVMEAAIRETVMALAAVILAVIGFYMIQPGMQNCPFDTPRWIRQTSCAAAASLLAMLLAAL